MTDAPEQIWAQDAEPSGFDYIECWGWNDMAFSDYPHIREYVRADIHAAALAEIERLRAALTRCANELEDEITANYPPHMLKYPHNQQKMKNDLEAVDKARATLEGGEEW